MQQILYIDIDETYAKLDVESTTVRPLYSISDTDFKVINTLTVYKEARKP